MKKFGSLKRLRAASLEELMTVPGIGRRTAEAVQAAIAQPEEGEASEMQPADPEESTLAPDGPAERGEPMPDSGDTAEVGRVGAGR
jgi:excinuclease ABC subunit C